MLYFPCVHFFENLDKRIHEQKDWIRSLIVGSKRKKICLVVGKHVIKGFIEFIRNLLDL